MRRKRPASAESILSQPPSKKPSPDELSESFKNIYENIFKPLDSSPHVAPASGTPVCRTALPNPAANGIYSVHSSPSTMSPQLSGRQDICVVFIGPCFKPCIWALKINTDLGGCRRNFVIIWKILWVPIGKIQNFCEKNFLIRKAWSWFVVDILGIPDFVDIFLPQIVSWVMKYFISNFKWFRFFSAIFYFTTRIVKQKNCSNL